MNLRRTLMRILLVPTLIGVLGCQEFPQDVDTQREDPGVAAEAFPLAGDGEPGITLNSPANFTYYETSDDPAHAKYNNNHPNVNVVAVFTVDDWAYPAGNRAVQFFMDEDQFNPIHTTQAPNGTGIALTDIPPGQHTITACLAWRANIGDDWKLVARSQEEDAVTGAALYEGGDSCYSLVVRVSIIGCYPPLFVDGAYVCDPSKGAETCCVDTNPCSVDNCVWSTVSPTPTDPNQPTSEFKCRFGPAPVDSEYGACCQSEFDCGWGERCYSVDNPDFSDDDGLVNHCYECDRLSPGADASCDNSNACTVDYCGDDWFCQHSPVVSPAGAPCCISISDCDDSDPCTIDTCADFDSGAGHGFCAFTSYQDLSDDELEGMGYAAGAFDRCCVIGKEFEYCNEHQVIVGGELVQDVCWDTVCINNQCRYGQDSDPLCCNTSIECEDCAVYDENGACAEANACTYDNCVDNHCEFSWNPFPPPDADCCQNNVDCIDDDPCTLDWCDNFVCKHELDPLCCVPDADPPILCPADPNVCRAYECNVAGHCDLIPNPAHANPEKCCLEDNDCDDEDACTEDVCNLVTNTCETTPIELTGSKPCCNVTGDCFDSNVCTNEICIANQCRYGTEPVDLEECASGKCCASNDDLNGNGSADACEVAGSCAPWQCKNHCCVETKDLTGDMCLTDNDCDDGDIFTWRKCVDCVCELQPQIVCDADHDNCDDGNPCTEDACDLIQGLCAYVPVSNCCAANTDCIPAVPDPCTNYQCILSQNICQNSYIPNCCDSDDDPKCNDFDVCTEDYCVNGKCRHSTDNPDCCTTAADCDDGRICTQDSCLPNENGNDKSCVHTVLDESPDGGVTQCCETDLACGQGDVTCTKFFCLNNACEAKPIPLCCSPSGQENTEHCNDNNPCTADWCLHGQCRHLGPDQAPHESISPLCCLDSADCKDDGNVCTDAVCGSDFLCTYVAKDPCILDLPIHENFNYKTFPFENIGWSRSDTLGEPSHYNWEYSTAGPQGLDFHLRFNGLKYPLDEFNAYMSSPAFRSREDAGGPQILTDVTVQWENFLDLAAPELTNTSIVFYEDGNILNGASVWGQASAGDVEIETNYAHFHKDYLGDYVQVGFNINALNGPGSAAHISGWDVDNVHICEGQRPVWVTENGNFGLFLNESQIFEVLAADPDGQQLTFSITGAPDFVSISSGGYDWQAKTWRANIAVNPTQQLALGEHEFYLTVSDGCLTVDKLIRLAVFVEGGYLIWVPEGVSEIHGARISDAIFSQADQPDAQRQWQTLTDVLAYPDLNLVDGIFACMGVKGAAHAFTVAEEAALANYIEAGGRVYIEGGDIWYDEPPTLINAYTKVTAIGGGPIKVDGPVIGRNFLMNLGSYSYSQLPYNPATPDLFFNSFNDQINVTEHTFGRVLMRNGGTIDYPLVVSYCDDADCADGSDAFRTIATSLPFAGYENGAKTRTDLMAKYLFFMEHGYPDCTGATQCDDGNECTNDVCDAVSDRCANAEIPGCVYCDDDRDCDDHFGDDIHACLASHVCQTVPGNDETSDFSNSNKIIDFLGMNPSVSSTITLDGSEDWHNRNVYTVNAKLRIIHAYAGELEVRLSHGMESVTLKVADLGEFEPDFYYTVEWGRDAALGSMADFTGKSIAGDWTLDVIDKKPGDDLGGRLVSWSLFVVGDEDPCANDAACNDSSACTVDQCLGGFCVNSPLVCTDYDPNSGLENLCTEDTCDPIAGCQYGPKACDDGNDCSVDKCDPTTGDCVVEWPDFCTNPCTVHADCGVNQYCNGAQCEELQGYIYDSPLTGSEAIPDDGGALEYILNIPSGTNVDSTGSAVDDRMVEKLRLKVMITHEEVSDLEIKLTRGTTVYTLLPLGTGAGAGQHWVFSSNDAAPFDAPGTNLDDPPDGTVGNGIVGEWKLSVQDKIFGNSGTLDGWRMFMVETQCFNNADCDDSSECSADTCVDNVDGSAKEKINMPKQCSNIDTGSACDDGLYCNGVETCHPTTGCVDGLPAVLDDGIACTDDICDEFNDEVFHLPNGSYCNDNDPCTNDVCDTDCSDGECGCVAVPNTDGCDDGVHCTINDTCAGGTCEGTPSNVPVGCACNTTPDCAAIFNSNRCAGDYVCLAGICQIDALTAVDCTTHPGYYKEACAEMLCDPDDGECKVMGTPVGVVCDDGDLCTVNETCNVNMQCVGQPRVCDDNYWCNGTEHCDELTGDCVAVDVPTIDDNVDCTIDVCDGDAQEVHHFADHDYCDDHEFCNGVEQCNLIQDCVDGPDPNCNDFNPCTIDACDEDNDQCFNADHVQHCSWPCNGEHDYDAGDSDCGYDDACVGGAGNTTGLCSPICDECFVARSITPNDPGLGLAIPDNDSVNCLVQTLEVDLAPNLVYVERVEARANIEHSSIMDLRVTLTDPDGYSIRMWETYGQSNDNFTNTFSLSYPDTNAPMCAFRGDSPDGTWTLEVCDILPQSQGVLQDWTLYVKGSETDTNMGDRCDNALALTPTDGKQTLVGSTDCNQDDHVGSCGGSVIAGGLLATGKDRVWRFNLGVHKLLNVDTPAGKDWVTYVKPADGSTCADNTTLACDKAPADNSDGSHFEVKLAPGTYYLFLDASYDAGAFAVDATFKSLLPNGGVCDDQNDCISDNCTDGTCCDLACDSLCERCDGLFTAAGVADKGTCTHIDSGLDPENECVGTDAICGGVCNGGGDCYLPGIEVAHVNAEIGGICQRCDGSGDFEFSPHGSDAFGQCTNRYCSTSHVFYEQRCANDPLNAPDRVGSCDCYDVDYGVFGCQPGDPEPNNDYCPGGYMCDPTDGLDDDALPDDCRTDCNDQAHCQYDGPVDGWYCEERAVADIHTCKERKELGDSCSAQDLTFAYGECFLNGADPYPCVDGVCCNTNCEALCMRCDGVDTLAGLPDNGTCTFIAFGEDPDAECDTDDTTLCGDGWCDAAGACDFQNTDVVCHDQSCGIDNNDDDLPGDFCNPDGTNCGSAEDWVFFGTDFCNDAGYCIDAGYQDCPGGFMCTDDFADCKDTCVFDADCSRPYGLDDCDADGGVNYYCRDTRCNPVICGSLLDATSNGSQRAVSTNFDSEAQVGAGIANGPVNAADCALCQATGACETCIQGAACGVCPGACEKPACVDCRRCVKGTNYGFYPITRAKDVPPQYPNP